MTGHFLYTITIYKSKKQLIIQKSMAPKLREKIWYSPPAHYC